MKNCYLTRCMRGGYWVLVALLALLAGTVMAEEIKIGGTGNGLGTMRLLGAGFSKKYPELKVSVLSSLGSSGAIKAVPGGALDIGIASRVLTDEERKGGIVASEFAQTPTVLAVSTKSSVTGITRAQIADIYAGKLIKCKRSGISSIKTFQNLPPSRLRNQRGIRDANGSSSDAALHGGGG